MKKLIVLLLFIPLVSFGQDFRKMNFGDSTEKLVEVYPDIKFNVGDEQGMEVLYHEEYISGIDTKVVFIFQNNKLELAGYIFNENDISSSERLKNYKNVSERLNKKYYMVNDDKWHNTTYKNEPNNYALSLRAEYVDFGETFKNERLSIIHFLGTRNGDLIHNCFYYSAEFHNAVQKGADSDF